MRTATNPGGGVSLNWDELAYDIGLGGLAQEIVANSHLQSYQDGNLLLGLQEELLELATDQIRQEIRQALERKLGVSLHLEMVVSSAKEATPLQAREQRLEQERQVAIEAIRQEKTVRKLQQAFTVELDETSVVRIENNI